MPSLTCYGIRGHPFCNNTQEILSIGQLNPIEVITPSEGLSTDGWPTAVKMFRKLQNHDGTPLIALDKGELEMDGVLEDGLAPDGKQMHVQRLGEGCMW